MKVSRRFFYIVLLILIFSVCSFTAMAGEYTSLDDAEEEFGLDDEEEIDLELQPLDKTSRGILSNLWTGHRFTYQHEFSYNVEKPRHVVTNRSSLRLEWDKFFANRYYIFLDGKVIAFAANDHQAKAEDKSYLLEGRLREGCLQLNLGKTSIKIGRQIIIWGEMEGAIITDVVSPRDTSEFLFGSLEDARLGQMSLLVDRYSSIGIWSFIVIPKPRTDRSAKPGTEYSMDMFGGAFQIEEEKPTWKDMEYGFRWKHTWGKIDMAFMLAHLLDNQAVYSYQGETPRGNMSMFEQFGRFSMMGSSMSFARGSFLWKGEFAFKANRDFQSNVISHSEDILERNTIDVAVGIDYSPTGNYTLGLETSLQHIRDWTYAIQRYQENESTLVLYWMRSFLRETLELQLMSSYQFQSQLPIVQVKSNYRFTDQLTGYFAADYLGTPSDNKVLEAFQDKSRITLEVECQF